MGPYVGNEHARALGSACQEIGEPHAEHRCHVAACHLGPARDFVIRGGQPREGAYFQSWRAAGPLRRGLYLLLGVGAVAIGLLAG